MYKSGTVFGHPAQVVNIPLGLTFQNIKILKPKKNKTWCCFNKSVQCYVNYFESVKHDLERANITNS